MRVRNIISALSAAVFAIASIAVPAAPALAQAYPSQTPVYIPTPVVAATACTAACDVTFITNGVGTAVVRVSGSGTGVAAIVQGTSDRASATWSTLPISAVGGATNNAIAGTGLWRVDTTGLATIRVHLTAVTGSVSISISGAPAAGVVQSAPQRKATYSAAIAALAPASSATDFFTLTGSATTTVRVTGVQCSGISTAAATATVVGLVRSTANSGGTATTPTAVKFDSSSPAATAVLSAYTANPTTGTLTGNVRAGHLTTVTTATSAFAAPVLGWTFGRDTGEQEIVLRGAAQSFSLNGNGASFTSGASLNCSVTWTEE